jgi:hypothetical protein
MPGQDIRAVLASIQSTARLRLLLAAFPMAGNHTGSPSNLDAADRYYNELYDQGRRSRTLEGW